MIDGDRYGLVQIQRRLDDLVRIRTLIGFTSREQAEFGRLVAREAVLLPGA
jgi:hypothetical protein